MGKHSRNAATSAVYTYAERQKDKSDGYGTQTRRVGSDSIADVDCCALSLQPCMNPVITPEGYIYEKEAILENLLTQKREIKRKQKEYERLVAQRSAEASDAADVAQAMRVAAFTAAETAIASSVASPFVAAAGKAPGGGASRDAAKPSVVATLDTLPSQVAAEPLKTAAGRQKAAMSCFWLPSNTPEAKVALPPRPDDVTRCPMTQSPLALKDLVDVHFTVADPSSSVPLISRAERYMCPVTQTVFRQHVPCVVLRPTGTVVTRDCFEKLIAADMLDPLTGGKLHHSDIIHVRNGGTGFSGSGATVASVKKPSMAAG